MEFLSDITPRRCTLKGGRAGTHPKLYLGQGQMAIEVVTIETPSAPANTTLRSWWHERNARRATPVVIVALHNESRASVCGAVGSEPPVYSDLDAGQVERFCREVLSTDDRHRAISLFGRTAETLVGSLAGLRNEGLFSNHELENRMQSRPDWGQCQTKARSAVGKKGDALLKSLGYRRVVLDNQVSLLQSDDDMKLALAVLLDEGESPDAASMRFAGLSPVTHALAKAEADRLPFVVMVSGPSMRVYPTDIGSGVGRRGRTETYVEAHSSLIPDSEIGRLWLIFSADALKPKGTFAEILEESRRYSGHLAANLRERIYDCVIPGLADAVVEARRGNKSDRASLDLAYEAALTILFRLLFISYAEDKDLLPYRYNGLYQRRSLKSKAQELITCIDRNEAFDTQATTLWEEINALFRAVDEGNKSWAVPRYNGGLFSDEKGVSPAGHLISQIKLTDAVIAPILAELLLMVDSEGNRGPVDFASLGVREFGTIYEGLLESELSVAETDLMLNKDDEYVPVQKEKDAVAIRKGQVYLHNASGARKSTGSYYTKDFAVQYLIDTSVVPSLVKHFERLDQMSPADAAEAIFDFKVADISMGSGHFLTAAIDTLEAAFSNYLSGRDLPGVRRELENLRTAAHEALGDIAQQIGEIEDDKLLRRLIARRCIYGVDLNPLAVQLASLAVWIHTFVPGLPLSLLDRNLVVGNSLVGVGTVDEIKDRLQSQDMPLFSVDADALLSPATEALDRLAHLSDATYADIQKGRKAIEEAEMATIPAKALCDMTTALSMCHIVPEGEDPSEWDRKNNVLRAFDFGDWNSSSNPIQETSAYRRARKILSEIEPFHFPVAFPEVFLRDNPGFDVILGNPPWEKTKTEEKIFWSRYFPGARSLSQREYEAARNNEFLKRHDLVQALAKEIEANRVLRGVLRSSTYSLGAGDTDLYKAFTWRFWALVRAASGNIGVVLPRTAFAGKGSQDFRVGLKDGGALVDSAICVNRSEWVFDNVEGRYSISLTNIRKKSDVDGVILRGPFAELSSFLAESGSESPTLTWAEVESWNEALCFPVLPAPDSIGVFRKMQKHPPVCADIDGQWKVRPNSELHATNDKPLMDLKSKDCPEGYWPVFKGESFNHWQPDTGTYYAWADPDRVLDHLFSKRLRSIKSSNSVFAGMDRSVAQKRETLDALHPRIAFRDITNRTNSRTFIPSLVPGGVFLTHLCPYWILRDGNESDLSYLLGVTSSIAFDWYSRNFIELHANFYLVNYFPVPRPHKDNILRKRVIELAGRLASPDDRFAKWAEEVGVDFGPLDPADKEDMICELDAVVAHLYGLTRSDVSHIFETFHVGWDYKPRLQSVLAHYDTWKTKP